MSETDPPAATDAAAGSGRAGIEALTGVVAVLGGILALAVAGLATASVLGRWLFNAPIDGDFEYVKMATAVAIFAYLPYTQARRGNIMVDTFTSWLPPLVCRAIDAFWDVAYAALMGFVAYCLVFGTLDAMRSGETTMQRQLPIWPSIMLAMALCVLLSLTSLVTAVLRLRRGRGRREGRS